MDMNRRRTVVSGPVHGHACRLLPGDDLVSCILSAASMAMENSNTQSAFVMSAVGSIDTVTLRMANASMDGCTISTTNKKDSDEVNEKDNNSKKNIDDDGAKDKFNKEEDGQRSDNNNKRQKIENVNNKNNKNDIRTWNERMEVVSLVGTFAVSSSVAASSSHDSDTTTTVIKKHLHMSVSDKDGNVYGGHVIAGTIFTTLELVLGTIQDVTFHRESDETTGYSELVVRSSSNEQKKRKCKKYYSAG